MAPETPQRQCPASLTPQRQHHWQGTTCRDCGTTRGRLSRLTDDRRVADRAVAAERARLRAELASLTGAVGKGFEAQTFVTLADILALLEAR